MSNHKDESGCNHDHGFTRRGLLNAGLAAGLVAPPLMFAPSASAQVKQGSGGRILVVLELSGGNDGLNTVIPYGRSLQRQPSSHDDAGSKSISSNPPLAATL